LYQWELAEIRLCKFLIFIEVIEKGNITIAFPLGGKVSAKPTDEGYPRGMSGKWNDA
jgi:hypothetical protein